MVSRSIVRQSAQAAKKAQKVAVSWSRVLCWPASTMDKLVDNFRYYGNLSNASIATSIVELLRQGRLHEGQWMALPAVGGGMNYGCWLLRFHDLKHPDAVLNPA